MAVDAELARRLVDAQFPQWAGLPLSEPAIQGHDNRTFRLGEDLAVRLPSEAAYAQQVLAEDRFLPALAPHLPLPIPAPVARGAPGSGFPWAWSVRRWLHGEPATVARVESAADLAGALAGFLRALGDAPVDGPAPGERNFFRGAPPAVYAEQVEQALAALGGEVPQDACRRVWEAAVRSRFGGPPRWLHGDVAPGNLLVDRGRLSAVIDFGCAAVGDPACDLAIAWTYLPAGAARDRFRAALEAGDGAWARGRGWALWKALVELAGALEVGDRTAEAEQRRTLAAVLDG